jgi:hypothetical protein
MTIKGEQCLNNAMVGDLCRIHAKRCGGRVGTPPPRQPVQKRQTVQKRQMPIPKNIQDLDQLSVEEICKNLDYKSLAQLILTNKQFSACQPFLKKLKGELRPILEDYLAYIMKNNDSIIYAQLPDGSHVMIYNHEGEILTHSIFGFEDLSMDQIVQKLERSTRVKLHIIQQNLVGGFVNSTALHIDLDDLTYYVTYNYSGDKKNIISSVDLVWPLTKYVMTRKPDVYIRIA